MKTADEYKILIETIPHGVQENDLDGKITYVNKAQCDLTGYSYAELTKLYIWDMIAKEEDKIQLKEYFRYLVKEQPPPETFFSVNKTKTGESLDVVVDWTYIRDDKGKLAGFVSIITDITQKKQMEREINAAKERYQALIDNASDAFFLANFKTGIIVDTNKAAEKLLGRTKEEIIGMHQTALHPPEKVEYYNKIFKEHIQSGRVISEDIYVVNKKGEHIPVDISAAPITLEREMFLLGIFRNISKLKLLDSKLKLFSQAIEQSAEGIAISDLEGNLEFINKAFAEMHGYKPTDLVGKNLAVFHTKEQLPLVEDSLKTMRTTGNFIGEIEHVRRDGSVFPTLMHNGILKNKEGNIIALIATAYDMTEYKKLQNDLVQEKERLSVTLKSIGDAMIATDTDGRITLLNAVAENLTGWKAVEASGKELKDVFRIINEITGEHVESPVEKVLKEGSIIGLANHTVLISRSGEKIPIEDSGAPIRNEEGAIIGVVLVFRDIRDKRKSEAELREARDKALRSEKLAIIGKLSSSIAHELRNPLGSIKNAQYFLKNRLLKMLDPEKNKLELKILDGIETEVNRSNRIISDLLGYSRERQLNRKPSQIISIIDRVLKSITCPPNIKIRCNSAQKDDVLVDPEQLEYAFRNVIINAIQSMEEKTSSEQGGLEINVSGIVSGNKQRNIEVSFKDSGNGMPDKIKDKIFEPLVSTKTKGTGLGLSIVKNIIDAHEGRIVIDSNEREGTNFKILLPVE